MPLDMGTCSSVVSAPPEARRRPSGVKRSRKGSKRPRAHSEALTELSEIAVSRIGTPAMKEVLQDTVIIDTGDDLINDERKLFPENSSITM